MRKYLIECKELNHTFKVRYGFEIGDLIASLVNADPDGCEMTFVVSVDEEADDNDE